MTKVFESNNILKIRGDMMSLRETFDNIKKQSFYKKLEDMRDLFHIYAGNDVIRSAVRHEVSDSGTISHSAAAFECNGQWILLSTRNENGESYSGLSRGLKPEDVREFFDNIQLVNGEAVFWEADINVPGGTVRIEKPFCDDDQKYTNPDVKKRISANSLRHNKSLKI